MSNFIIFITFLRYSSFNIFIFLILSNILLLRWLGLIILNCGSLNLLRLRLLLINTHCIHPLTWSLNINVLLILIKNCRLSWDGFGNVLFEVCFLKNFSLRYYLRLFGGKITSGLISLNVIKIFTMMDFYIIWIKLLKSIEFFLGNLSCAFNRQGSFLNFSNNGLWNLLIYISQWWCLYNVSFRLFLLDNIWWNIL